VTILSELKSLLFTLPAVLVALSKSGLYEDGFPLRFNHLDSSCPATKSLLVVPVRQILRLSRYRERTLRRTLAS
jgi:hypothetical protein